MVLVRIDSTINQTNAMAPPAADIASSLNSPAYVVRLAYPQRLNLSIAAAEAHLIYWLINYYNR